VHVRKTIEHFMNIVGLRFTDFENSSEPNITNNLSFTRIKHKLNELGKSFVLVPAHKATNSVAIHFLISVFCTI